MAITAYKTKQGARYIADLYMDGKKAARKRGFLSKRAARDWMEEKRRELSLPTETRLMFSDLANPYLAYSLSHHAPGTFSYKRASCSRLVHYIQGQFPPATEHEALLFFPINALTPQTCDAYIESLRQTKGATFANRELRELNSIFKWGIRKGILAYNPFASTENYPEKEFVRTIPTREEVFKARSCCSPEERDLFDFVFYTAGRPISLYRLKWSDIDFKRNTVRLWIKKRKGGMLESYLLKMPDGLRQMLLRRWQQRMPDVDLVFHNEAGSPLHKNSRVVKYLFHRICERADIPLFTATDLRSFLASSADDAGLALRNIQGQFGHKRQSTTENYIKKLRASRGITDLIEDMDSEMVTPDLAASGVKME